MLIEEIEKILNERYKYCVCSIEKASMDDSNGDKIYLCNSQRNCYNYDAIIAKELDGKDFISSVDAITICHGYINFIEFKNGKISNDVKKGIRQKIMEGTYYFERFILQGNMMSFNNIHTRFILVYNANTCYKEIINSNIFNRANVCSERRFIKSRYDKDWHIFDEAISLPVEVFQKRIEEFA